jgi:hypothetical protein
LRRQTLWLYRSLPPLAAPLGWGLRLNRWTLWLYRSHPLLAAPLGWGLRLNRWTPLCRMLRLYRMLRSSQALG